LTQLVHIVDDDAQVRAATSYLLASKGYATEIYVNGAEFLRDADLERGCILLDLRMPGMSGLEVQEELAARGVLLPVVVITGHGDVATAVRAMKLGAVDFLEKPYREQDLTAAVEGALSLAARRNDRHESEITAKARLQALSPRETQVLQGLLGGLSNKEIARRLDLSPRTVEMHRANLMGSLGAESLSEAIRLALDANLVPLDRPTD
jgi:FixJ family two-component response regulator